MSCPAARARLAWGFTIALRNRADQPEDVSSEWKRVDDTFFRFFRHDVHALDVTVVRDARLFLSSDTSSMITGASSPVGLADISAGTCSFSMSGGGVLGLGDKDVVESRLSISAAQFWTRSW